MNPESWALLAATVSVAFFHTFSPDHWLPFVMVGRAQKWGIIKTELVALAAGTGHVGTSVIIALIGVFIGSELSANFAAIAETATGAALVIFGFGYAIYMWRKGGHAHFTIGGSRFDVGHTDDHTSSAHGHEHDEHEHEHDKEEDCQCHEHDDHSHDQSEQTQPPAKSKAGYGLIAIMGLTPCIALLPLAFGATAHSTGLALLVMLVFAIATIVPILVLTYLGLKGLSVLKLDWFERYGDIIAGVVIGCIGLMTMFLGL